MSAGPFYELHNASGADFSGAEDWSEICATFRINAIEAAAQ
jgi:hypothetical protein